MAEIRFNTADLANADLNAGDRILLSGTVYTARDAAHKRFMELLDKGEPLPFPIKGSVIFYAGPTPARNGHPVGSCGPTTSSRMDPYTPRLLELGLAAIIGKGDRNEAVHNAIKDNGALYLCAVGGAGALLAQCITNAEEIAFADLGCESVKRFTIKDMPLFVGIDRKGGSVFENSSI